MVGRPRSIEGRAGAGAATPLRALGALGLLLAPGLARPAQDAPSPARVHLSPGPAAEAFGADGELPARPPPVELDWPAWTREAWSDPAPWRRWAELVAAERDDALRVDPRRPDPARRAALARLAIEQGRWADAWGHFAALRGDADALAALLPAFLPGLRRGAGERPLLAPAPPPPIPPETPLEIEHKMALDGLALGASTVDLEVVLDRDGLLVELRLAAGPALDVDVTLPVPAGVRLASAWAMWEEADPARPLRLRLSPDEPEASAWGRFASSPRRWPVRLPEGLTAQLEEEGLTILGDDPRLPSFAEALETLLGIRVTLGGAPPAPDATGVVRDPVVLRLGDDAPPEKLAGLVSRVEAFLLGEPLAY